MDKTLSEIVIKVENLSKKYGSFEAVKGVSFEVKKGEIFGLIGPDGAGKTSVIQMLAGVASFTSGEASITGLKVSKHAEKIKEFIGYMPQGLGTNLYDNLTVEENINFFKALRLIPQGIFEKNKELLLEITRLKPFLKRPVKTLSGGMRQKLALICTLLHLPDILLLDEPTTGVDPISRQDFWKIIHNFVKEKEITVLLTTSYMDEAERCHKIALMHEGVILLEDYPEKIIDLEDTFIEKITGKKWEKDKKEKIYSKDLNKEPVIICKEVSKTFGSFIAVNRVNLEIIKGEIFGLLGPNGAGKTTLIKMMCGLLEPTEGKILVNGLDVIREKTKIWETVGYMSQRFSLYKDLTVLENLKLYANLYQVKNLNLKESLDFLGLTEFKDRVVRDLPFGIRQRIALACALLHEPKIVFLDEPTSGVDPVARKIFWEIIYEVSRKRGITVIVSTHYMDEAEHCDRVAFMNRGKIVALGTPEEIKEQSEKNSGFLLEIRSAQYKKALDLISQSFSEFSVYGRKIYVRTFNLKETEDKIKNLFQANKLSLESVKKIPIPLQEAFVDFIKRTEEHEF